MTIHWETVVQGVITGAVASGVLGSLALAREWYRNCILRESIIEGFSETGAGSSIEGLTVYIRNHTGREFTVRHVSINAGEIRFGLNLTEEMGTSRSPKDIFQDLGGEVLTEVGITSLTKKMTKGFAAVKPYTYRVYLLPLEAVEQLSSDFDNLCIQVTAEYQDWSDRTVLITAKNKGWAKKAMKDTIKHLQREIAEGRIYQLRNRFKMPSVRQ